jgi:hypothetical protein
MEINKCANRKVDCVLNKVPRVVERMLQYVYCIQSQQLLLVTKGSRFSCVMFTGLKIKNEINL